VSDQPENERPPRGRLTSSGAGPSGQGAGGEDSSKQALSELDRRVKVALDQRQAQAKAEEALLAQAENARASGAAWRIIIDLVAATGLLGGLGYALDAALGWSPVGLLTGLLAGFVLGMWLAARRAMAMQARTNQDGPGD
jgi:F0F1-type ATP synthase assembly protein I